MFRVNYMMILIHSTIQKIIDKIMKMQDHKFLSNNIYDLIFRLSKAKSQMSIKSQMIINNLEK